MLDVTGYADEYIVDFYGAFDTDYEEQFNDMIKGHGNINYKGFLNMLNKSGYDTLSTYDVMLFPTYWDGEGFAGVVLDANMSGLPIIASDWNMNKEVVQDGKTGFIIPVHDYKALANRMKAFINGDVDLLSMKQNCLEYVKQFDYRKVVTRELLQNLGLLS